MEIFELLTNFTFWLKIIILLITISYCIFAFVVINQIRAMDKIIHLPPTKIVISISIFNLILGASLFLLSLVIL